MKRTRTLILTALFAALTAVGALIRIPTPTSSFTLQIFFTAMAGVLLGPKWGALSQMIYVGLGLMGLPIFTLGGGPTYLLQPSFGFLLGLIPATGLIGAIAQRSPTKRRVLLACLAGELVLYGAGLPYMYLILNVCLGQSIAPEQLLWTGMVICLPGDALKIAAVTALAPALARRLSRPGT